MSQQQAPVKVTTKQTPTAGEDVAPRNDEIANELGQAVTAGADEYLDEQASSDIKKLQRSIVAKLTGMDAPGEQPDKEDDDVSGGERIPETPPASQMPVDDRDDVDEKENDEKVPETPIGSQAISSQAFASQMPGADDEEKGVEQVPGEPVASQMPASQMPASQMPYDDEKEDAIEKDEETPVIASQATPIASQAPHAASQSPYFAHPAPYMASQSANTDDSLGLSDSDESNASECGVNDIDKKRKPSSSRKRNRRSASRTIEKSSRQLRSESAKRSKTSPRDDDDGTLDDAAGDEHGHATQAAGDDLGHASQAAGDSVGHATQAYRPTSDDEC